MPEQRGDRATALALPPPPKDGWRDEPITIDPCEACDGWGIVTPFVAREVGPPKKRRMVEMPLEPETCEACLGTGRKPASD